MLVLVRVTVLACVMGALAAPVAGAAEGTWRGTISIDASTNEAVHESGEGSIDRSASATLNLAARGTDGAKGSDLVLRQTAVRLGADYRYDATWVEASGGHCTPVYRLSSRGPVSGQGLVSLTVGRQAGLLEFGRSARPPWSGPHAEGAWDDPHCLSWFGGPDLVVTGGLGVCARPGGFAHEIPGLRELRRVELRREGKRLVRRLVLRGTVRVPCASELMRHGQATYAFDLVFYPGPARYEPAASGGMGLVCGRAGHDWHTVAKRRTAVTKGRQACVFLLGNGVARELLATALRTGKTLTTVFGRELATEAARELADDAAELAIGAALRQRGWSALAKHAPFYFRAFRAAVWQTRIGEAVALQAVPLSATFAVNQIRTKHACVQVVAATDRNRLTLDWQLVYAPTALKHPKRDRKLTRAHTYRKEVRRFRPDRVTPSYVGLTCARGGVVDGDAASPSAFSSLTAHTVG